MSKGEGSADGSPDVVEGGMMDNASVLSAVCVGFVDVPEVDGFWVTVDDSSSSSSVAWRFRRSMATAGGGVAVAWTRLVP